MNILLLGIVPWPSNNFFAVYFTQMKISPNSLESMHALTEVFFYIKYKLYLYADIKKDGTMQRTGAFGTLSGHHILTFPKEAKLALSSPPQ